MELKLGKYIQLRVATLSSNRTFMELKLVHYFIVEVED